MKRLIVLFFLFSLNTFGEFSWTFPSQTISTLGHNTAEPFVKMNDYGNVLCIFLDEMAPYTINSVISSDYGASWASDKVISSAPTSRNSENSFDLNNLGDAAVIFNTNYNTNIYHSYSSDFGDNWSSPTSLVAQSRELNLAINDNRVGLFAYSDYSSLKVEVYSTSDGGENWSSEYSANNSFLGRVAINNNNQAVATLVDRTSPNYPLYSLHGTWNGSTFSFASQLISSETNIGYIGNLKMNDAGFALYAQKNVSAGVIEFHSTDAGVTFSSNLLDTVGGSNIYCDIDDNGYGIVVWIRTDGSHDRIVEKHTINYGSGWSSLAYLSLPDQNSTECKVACDMLGNTFVSWRYYLTTSTVQTIWSLDKGNTWSNIINISPAGQGASEPVVTIDRTGHVVIVFRTNNGSNAVVESINGSWISEGLRTETSKRNVDFFLTRELVYTINWDSIPFAVRYNLYRYANLQKHFATTDALKYEIRNSKIGDQYYLTWEDGVGVQRDATELIVK